MFGFGSQSSALVAPPPPPPGVPLVSLKDLEKVSETPAGKLYNATALVVRVLEAGETSRPPEHLRRCGRSCGGVPSAAWF